MLRRMRPLLAVGLVLTLLLLSSQTPTSSAAPSNDNLWRDVPESGITLKGERLIVPQKYRTVAVDETILTQRLLATPREKTPAAKTAPLVMTLPMPDGTYQRFQVEETALLAPDLAAQFPEIKTYQVQGLDDPTATGRLDRTPAGFHAMILAAANVVFIDPYSRNDTTNYLSYYKHDFVPSAAELKARGLEEFDPASGPPAEAKPASTLASGPTLRTYRLAVAATGEYTAFHGGTVAQAQAAIVTSINRVDGVYEREVAVRFTLINNTAIIYTNGATDPYTNNNGSAMLSENQTNLTNVVGAANYDIGHVFSTGGGGIASLGSVCNSSRKAQGVTGSPSPVADAFDIDYVAHEMGHQFGGNHTFNGTTGSCGGGNRSAGAAYEPGSGTTIMAYAGICGAEDLAPHSRPRLPHQKL